MNAVLAWLSAAAAFLKAVPWYAVALPLIFLAGCCGGCCCERARPHILQTEPEVKTTVLTIDGKDYTYDRTPGGGWKRRD